MLKTYKQLYGFKQLFLLFNNHLLYGFNLSSLILIICALLNGFNYSYQILIICTQLYGFTYVKQ